MSEPVLRKEMQVWAANGLIMMCDDGPHGWDAGQLLVEDLLAFAEHAAKFFPGEKVYVHQFGLRVTTSTPTPNSPFLEWRDWT